MEGYICVYRESVYIVSISADEIICTKFTAPNMTKYCKVLHDSQCSKFKGSVWHIQCLLLSSLFIAGTRDLCPGSVRTPHLTTRKSGDIVCKTDALLRRDLT